MQSGELVLQRTPAYQYVATDNWAVGTTPGGQYVELSSLLIRNMFSSQGFREISHEKDGKMLEIGGMKGGTVIFETVTHRMDKTVAMQAVEVLLRHMLVIGFITKDEVVALLRSTSVLD